jgi:hypothetical protein
MVPVQTTVAAVRFSSSGYLYKAGRRPVTRYQHVACAAAEVEADRASRERSRLEELANIAEMAEIAIAASPERAEELRAQVVVLQARINERYAQEAK